MSHIPLPSKKKSLVKPTSVPPEYRALLAKMEDIRKAVTGKYPHTNDSSPESTPPSSPELTRWK